MDFVTLHIAMKNELPIDGVGRQLTLHDLNSLKLLFSSSAGKTCYQLVQGLIVLVVFIPITQIKSELESRYRLEEGSLTERSVDGLIWYCLEKFFAELLSSPSLPVLTVVTSSS